MKIVALAASLVAVMAVTACSTDKNAIEQNLASASEASASTVASEPSVIEAVNTTLTTPDTEQAVSTAATTEVVAPVVVASDVDNKETAAPKTPIQATEVEQASIN